MKQLYQVPSADGVHTLSGVLYIPEGDPKGYIHIVHGMTEYIGRYDRLMTDLCAEGYLVFGYDHLGHGRTARDKSELGYIAKKGGHDLLCRDIKAFSDGVMAEYGPLPYYLLGHSMGSFIVRIASEKYVKPDRLIIMGTGGPKPEVGAGIALASLVKAVKGERHCSDLIDKLAFGGNNKRFRQKGENESTAWLTRNPEIRKAYEADDHCSFRFTVSAMCDLFRLLRDANRSAWFRNIPETLPMLLVSGAEDPIGNDGKGVKKVHDKLKKQGKDVRMILYPDARHEIVNDITYEQVREDLLSFLE